MKKATNKSKVLKSLKKNFYKQKKVSSNQQSAIIIRQIFNLPTLSFESRKGGAGFLAFSLITTFLLILSTLNSSAQSRTLINDNAYLVITNSVTYVIDNANPNAITTTGTGGNIISEGENNVLKWNIGTNTGNYVIPFTTANVKIPLQVNITTAGTGSGSMLFSTYSTANNNTIYPTGVTNLNACSGDKGLSMMDRFWLINSSSYTTVPSVTLNIGYDTADIVGTNTITEANLQAVRYNLGSNSWEMPTKMYGTTNTATNVVENGVVPASDFYKIWTLIDTQFVVPATSTDIQTACNSYTWMDSITYTSSTTTPTYTIVGGSATGCDSIVTLNLTINAIDISTTTTGFVITANQAGATYQWIDCNNGNSIIVGETGQNYTASVNGDYAVIVTINGCVDTSACVSITSVGVNESTFASGIYMYPNPTNENITIDLGIITDVNIVITTVTGKEVYKLNHVKESQLTISLAGFSKGVYFVKVQNDKQQKIIKLIKN